MRTLARMVTLVVVIVILAVITTIKGSQAAISSCTSSISPGSIQTDGTADLTFSITNGSDNTIQWIQITRPSESYTLNGCSAPWPCSALESQVMVGGVDIGASGSGTISASVTAGSNVESSANWTVAVSDDAGGVSPTTCTGSLGTAITQALTISSLSISDVSQTSVKITWTTNSDANSVIDYGTSSSYGSTKSDSTMTTSHSLTLDSLSANTTYHFNVKSTDSSSNTAEVGDNTFVSSKAATTSTTTVTNTTTETKTVTKLIEDTEKPVITFKTKFNTPFSAVPTISGKVTDNAGVADIEYSIDGGANYLPVDETTGLRSKNVDFNFTLFGLFDGDYKVRVRATDLSANVQTTGDTILVFDRLPPSVGGVLYSLGSQILTSENGVLKMIAGVDFKIILSAIGGPTEIKITANTECGILNIVCGEEVGSFSLAKNADTGLWSGPMSFAEPGLYTLVALSIDGAGNETVKEIGVVNVLPKGRISFRGGSDLQSTISIYYFEPTTQQFTLWDGIAYGQENPIEVDTSGNYSIVLPPGKYYLAISNSQLAIRNSEIFTLDKTTPINANFDFSELKRFELGPISFTLPEVFQPALRVDISRIGQTGLISEAWQEMEFPSFELVADGSIYDSFYFRGKSTVYSFLNTWLPETPEQLGILGSLGSLNINSVVVMPQESISKVSIYKNTGGYETLVLADPDGVLFNKLGINTLPLHFLVNRSGVVMEVAEGVVMEEVIVGKLLSE